MNLLLVSALLIIIGIIAFFSLKKNETFCNCLGMKYQTCPDMKKLKQLYLSGKLTENTFDQYVEENQ